MAIAVEARTTTRIGKAFNRFADRKLAPLARRIDRSNILVRTAASVISSATGYTLHRAGFESWTTGTSLALAKVENYLHRFPHASSLKPIDIIAKKRDRKELNRAEIYFIYKSIFEGSMPPAQLGAYKMAVELNGFSENEEAIGKEIDAIYSQKQRIYDRDYWKLSRKEQASFIGYQTIIGKTADESLQLTREDVFSFIQGVVDGTVSDFQAGQWLMAVKLKGLTDDETAYLTEAMWRTGGSIKLDDIPGPKADKHAAGGSSDNTSFLIAPLLACFGVTVPMMSGRSLAHTGGTLDKLESIKGFNVNLTEEQIREALRAQGLAIFGQMPTIAPADKRLYALRDTTGTVQSTPLIAASIMSKKLAEGADNLALLGTFGSGAFATDADDAAVLSTLMLKAGQKAGRNVRSFLVDMSQPLTPNVGPALEMQLAIEVLKGRTEGCDRFLDATIEIAANLLVMAEIYKEDQIEQAKIDLRAKLQNGKAFGKFREMVIAQGGDPRVLDDYSLFPQPKTRIALKAPRSGFVQAVHAGTIGVAANMLGAGRTNPGDPIDHAVGVADIVPIGTQV